VQAVSQDAKTVQLAGAKALADQTAVNANTPVAISAGPISSGSSSATQNADNTAAAVAANKADTDQIAVLEQDAGGSDCKLGCGGAGGVQAVSQDAKTVQLAGAKALADQTAVNANTPVAISAGPISGGSSSATQDADNTAAAIAFNKADTDQTAVLKQDLGGSHCKLGCGGGGGVQALSQDAKTIQLAGAKALADQTAVNANVPVSISGGSISGGSSSATQDADNTAAAIAANKADTDQTAVLKQDLGGDDCRSKHDRPDCDKRPPDCKLGKHERAGCDRDSGLKWLFEFLHKKRGKDRHPDDGKQKPDRMIDRKQTD
jgi:hypothetical protein